MHAYLITSPNSDTRHQETNRILSDYHVTPFSLITLTTSTSHTIDAIRDINRSLVIRSTRPGEYRAVAIENAHLMTTEAQNAFLKTLEEPPSDTIIILESESLDAILPTIQSRCVLITIPPESSEIDIKKQQELFEKIGKMSIGERIKFTETLGKSREESLEFIRNQLDYLHTLMHNSDSPVSDNPISGNPKNSQVPIVNHLGGEIGLHLGKSHINLINALLCAHSDLSHNVNPKIVLFEVIRRY